MKVLVFGASGMIGSAMFRVLSAKKEWQVWGTLRSADGKRFFSREQQDKLLAGVDVEKHDALVRMFARVKPEVVVNCIGLTKHHKVAEDPQLALPLNALLPHRMADLCAVAGARLIHVSTDCVFAGTKGNYAETDAPDAGDVYGKSKYLGEVDYSHAITLRTSTIGHELQSAYGLLEWFLAQQGSCKGFNRAIFSGLPSTEFARVVREVVIPQHDLHGLYHVGADPIGKYELLKFIAKAYCKQIDVVRDDEFTIDRSLNSSRFSQVTGYKAAGWPELIHAMHASR
ncbi:dTDP-4-dehydrorhamnose reductase family protein [Rhodoferax aquaticus]|uniref:dTDP-4-dehydrorhamnose reductase n=1 Tax=Rhodoferax aquaticus TaxID=2527691 RepID=A0A515ERH1_9BURK|nr:SDR family oxidoreductase [Rhodoferax aquaticus]QDL55223.1 SDR family oxidoreductase [Rhodoferax aquaticus]